MILDVLVYYPVVVGAALRIAVTRRANPNVRDIRGASGLSDYLWAKHESEVLALADDLERRLK